MQLSVTPPAGSSSLYRFAHDAMATTFEACIAASSRAYAEAAAGAAFAEVDRLERELSRFVPDSDIARINALPAGGTVKVGADAFECLQLAYAVWQETGGAFDVTVGGLLSNRPKAEASAEPVPIGMNLLHLDAGRREVGVSETGLVVDLGAIGKGYAVDQAVELLGDWGIARGLVHAGQSSVFALGDERGESEGTALPLTPIRSEEGRPGAGGGWRMPLRHPRNAKLVLGHVKLLNASLGGSGRLLHGEHILDPRTRNSCRVETLAAWAVADSAAMSDAFSTAFMVMTPQQVEACCLRHPGVSAILVLAAQEGRLELLRFGTAEWISEAPPAD